MYRLTIRRKDGSSVHFEITGPGQAGILMRWFQNFDGGQIRLVVFRCHNYGTSETFGILPFENDIAREPIFVGDHVRVKDSDVPYAGQWYEVISINKDTEQLTVTVNVNGRDVNRIVPIRDVRCLEEL